MMTTLTIPVDKETKAAFDKATAEMQRTARKKAAALLRRTLLSPKERAEEFNQFLDSVGERAEARGWTDDMNEALLRGDYDDD